MRSVQNKLPAVAWSGVVAFSILGFGQGIWGILLVSNLKASPAIPWACPVMALVLWLMWRYLGGSWWPHSTAASRRGYLRANPVSRRIFLWTMLSGLLSIGALAGYWIVLSYLTKMPPNAVPDMSPYPILTGVVMVMTASLVSPVTEESAFRGYCQVILEREFAAPTAIAISSVLFALAHITHGLLWPKLLVYFLVGIVFGAQAYLAKSIIPVIPVHIVGDLTFFMLVWPHDTARRVTGDSAADKWFWVHVVQSIVLTVLAVLAFNGLVRATQANGSRRTVAGPS